MLKKVKKFSKNTRRENKSNRNIPTVLIGIAGISKGMGVTHLGLMLAVFLAAVRGAEVALVELNDSECLRQAEIILQNKAFRNTNKKIKMISIYAQAGNSVLSQILSESYEYVIVDFGNDYEMIRQQFLMCQVKIIMGSTAWWKMREFVAFLAKNESEESRKYWAFLSFSAADSGTKYLKDEFGINVLQVPYEPDPFFLGVESLDFLDRLLNQMV